MKKYTLKEVYAKMREIEGKIKSHKNFNDMELDELSEEAHDYIANSEMTYTQAYSLAKAITTSQAEFNMRMGRIRNTILNRGR